MSLGSLYEDAVNSGDTAMANYYAKMLAANAGININTNDVTAATPGMLAGNSNSVSLDIGNLFPDSSGTPSVIPSASQGSTYVGAFTNTLLHPLDTLKGFFDPKQAAANAGADNSMGVKVDSTRSAISFITDIPRVATTLLGLILIIAGIFALSKGPAVNIVSSAVREAVTS